MNSFPSFEKLNLTKSEELFKEAQILSPGGVQGIRRPYNFVEGEYPIFFDKGTGGRIQDVDGNEYIDMLCAYGPIIIGHREKEIEDAVIAQIRDYGHCMSLTQPTQNQLLSKLKTIIPCFEKGVLLKTGSDATTAAIRIARAYTDRNKIMRCGYHGWHDWCVEVKGGVPKHISDEVFEFHYNDIDSLEVLLKAHGKETAAIIITPVGHPLGAPVMQPLPGFLEAVQQLAKKYGIVLIFDEIRSGFRVHLGGAQKLYGITPDLAVFGKAMGNGYSISAICGKQDIMDVLLTKAFLSSTFFPNSLAQVAALATIEFMMREKVTEVIAKRGKTFEQKVTKIIENSGILCEFSGGPSMPFITFPKAKNDPQNTYKKLRTEFYKNLIRKGVFLQPFHHGYIAFRHTEQDLQYVAESIEQALAQTKKTVLK
jgi:glutamate-1-semialdehyde aminotransferase